MFAHAYFRILFHCFDFLCVSEEACGLGLSDIAQKRFASSWYFQCRFETTRNVLFELSRILVQCSRVTRIFVTFPGSIFCQWIFTSNGDVLGKILAFNSSGWWRKPAVSFPRLFLAIGHGQVSRNMGGKRSGCMYTHWYAIPCLIARVGPSVPGPVPNQMEFNL